MNKLNLILLVAAVLVGLLFLGFSSGRMQAWQSRFLDVSTPALHAGAAISGKISKLSKGLKTLDELEAENAALLVENSELRALNQLRGELEAENRRLRAALDYRERAEFQLLPAQILSRDADSWWRSVKIDRGFADAVDTAQPVLTGEGLVGRTTTVAKDVSIVLLLTDENCRVAARVEGTDEQGILSGRRVNGQGAPELVLNFLRRDAKLEPGMKVYSAGVSGGVFPSGIPLGTIKEFRARELDGQAVVEPAADFARLDDVFVVLGKK